MESVWIVDRTFSLEASRHHPPTGVEATEYVRADVVDRLKSGCNPTCPGCGLRPCNEDGLATLWCDECVCALQAEVDRLRAIKAQSLEALKAVERRLGIRMACDAPDCFTAVVAAIKAAEGE